MLLVVYVPHARAVSINFFGGTDFRIASITDLLIAGPVYDATFNYGTLFNALPAPPITFSSENSAKSAATALNNAITTAALDISAASLFTASWIIHFVVTH